MSLAAILLTISLLANSQQPQYQEQSVHATVIQSRDQQQTRIINDGLIVAYPKQELIKSNVSNLKPNEQDTQSKAIQLSAKVETLEEMINRIEKSNPDLKKTEALIPKNNNVAGNLHSSDGQINSGSSSSPANNIQVLMKTENSTSRTILTVKNLPEHWQVKSLLNVSLDYPLAASRLINGYIWPLMAVITLFTNTMIVVVLSQPDMRTPSNIVLIAIAIADVFPIVIPVPWLVYLFTFNNDKQVLYPPLACYLYQHSTRSVSEVFYFLSTWLNVLLAVLDYLSACHPESARRFCKLSSILIQISILTLLSLLLNLPQALKIVFKPVEFMLNGQRTYGCRALQAKWFKDLVGGAKGVALYDDVFASIIIIFVDGGPSLLLISMTVLLIKHLRNVRESGIRLVEQARTASDRRLARDRQQELESSTRVMIFVLLAFLSVKIPFATTFALMIIQSRFEIRFVEELSHFQTALSITDLVFVLSYQLNFTIFCCFSKKFRHKVVEMLSGCWLVSPRKSLPSIKDTSEQQRKFSLPAFMHHNHDREKHHHHLDEDTSTRLLAQALESGELCRDCIARYEQLRAAPVLAAAAAVSSASRSHIPAIVTTKSSVHESLDVSILNVGSEFCEDQAKEERILHERKVKSMSDDRGNFQREGNSIVIDRSSNSLNMVRCDINWNMHDSRDHHGTGRESVSDDAICGNLLRVKGRARLSTSSLSHASLTSLVGATGMVANAMLSCIDDKLENAKLHSRAQKKLRSV